MADLVTINGSPSKPSRTEVVLERIRELAGAAGLTMAAITVRDINAEALLYGQFNDPIIQENTALVSRAKLIVVATPVYKAAYSGVLKVFLDILPAQALAGKIVLPIATGGSLGHMLVVDYALKPVLAALGAEKILSGLYILDTQIQKPVSDQDKVSAASSLLAEETDIKIQDVTRQLIRAAND